jgi:hypothetical protein
VRLVKQRSATEGIGYAHAETMRRRCSSYSCGGEVGVERGLLHVLSDLHVAKFALHPSEMDSRRELTRDDIDRDKQQEKSGDTVWMMANLLARAPISNAEEQPQPLVLRQLHNLLRDITDWH